MKHKHCPSLLATAIALALAAPTTFAQQAEEPAKDGDARVLEEVTVTARKQDESLQEVPVTVSAFNKDALQERDITDVNSLATFAPGLSFSQAFGRSTDRPVIRGQGNVLANVQFGVESGTAYFIDGVYYNGDIQALDFDMLDRVEVIKGPQSALYGRNTYAGAINFITRDPGVDEWTGTTRATLGDHDERTYSISMDGPVFSDKLLARFGARWNNYGGEYINQATGNRVGQEHDKTFSATVVFRPTDSLNMRLFSMHRDQDDGTPALFLVGADRNNCRPGFRSIAYRPGRSAATGGFAPVNNNNQYYCGTIPALENGIWLNTDTIGPTSRFPNNGFFDGTAFDGYQVNETFTSLLTEYFLGETGWQVNALVGYRQNKDLFGTDSDHSEANVLVSAPGVAEPLFANTNRNDRREWSGELKLMSPTDQPLQGLIGAYYYELDDIERDLTYAAPEFGIPLGNATGIQNKAVFASVKYAFNERFNAGLELRHSQEQKYRDEISATGAVTLRQRGDYDSTTPRLTLDYKLSDDLMIYGVLAQGARPGGLNGTAGAATGRPTYDQEESDNFELGFKSTLMDGRLRFNGAFYFIDSSNVQVTQAIAGGGGGAITSIAVNQASAETKGVELEVQALLTDYLTLSAGATWLDPKFTEGCDDFEYVLNSGGIAYLPSNFGSPLCDISGNRLPLTPKTQGNLVLSYDRPLSNGLTFFTNATYTHEGSKYVQVHNLAETGSTSLFGLKFGLRGDSWSMALYGRNLTDEDTVPLATRWFDLRYGGCPASPAAACTGPAGAAPLTADRGTPRALFAALRKGRTIGFEVRYDF
jgi:outer membrane receptor protein involved in Fe transport